MNIKFDSQNDVKEFAILVIAIATSCCILSAAFFINYSDSKNDRKIAELNNTIVDLKTSIDKDSESKLNQISDLKEAINTYEVKIDFLRMENEKYLNWLQSDSTKIPFLEKRLLELKNKNIALQDIVDNLEVENNSGIYSIESGPIKRGQSFTDHLTLVTVGVKEIHVTRDVDLQLSLPGHNERVVKDVIAGKNYPFSKSGKNYILIIKEIKYIEDEVTFLIKEV